MLDGTKDAICRRSFFWRRLEAKSMFLLNFQQGGNFGKKNRFCRPTADPTKKFQGQADRSPIRRRFSPTADFVGDPDFPRLLIFSEIFGFSLISDFAHPDFQPFLQSFIPLLAIYSTFWATFDGLDVHDFD